MLSLNSVKTLTLILTIIIIVIVILLAILVMIYFLSKRKKEKVEKREYNGEPEKELPKSKTFGVESVFNFMEFDKVEDNMIIQKNGAKFVMVVECQGINYDLMSGMEKNAVEEGFIQFLNTIRHPIQIYVQTRTLNLENSIQTYKARVKEIEERLELQEKNYKEMVENANVTKEQLDKAYYELTKQRNLAEYGKDIIYDTEKMSLNKNVLNQKYYIIVPYFPEELGDNDFDKEEIKNMAFSELYTRCQSIIRTLSACSVNGKILDSYSLIDLLYVAYNRDESETYGLEKALRAGYDELYSTAPDVMDKKISELNKKIEQEAFNLANEKVEEAKTEKQRRYEQRTDTMDDLIAQMAKLIITQNSDKVGKDIAESAKEKIDKEKEERRGRKSKTEEEGGDVKNVKEKTKRRKTKTA